MKRKFLALCLVLAMLAAPAVPAIAVTGDATGYAPPAGERREGRL